MKTFSLFVTSLLIVISFLSACSNAADSKAADDKQTKIMQIDTAQYYLFRPKVEKEYGYSHAVKIGDDLKISGAVSMDDNGVIVAPGNMEQQLKNCYSDLEKIFSIMVILLMMYMLRIFTQPIWTTL